MPSTSQTKCTPSHSFNPQRKAVRMPPCRITNTQREIYQSLNRPDPATLNGEWVEFTQVPDPEKGTMHQQVKRTFTESLGDNQVDVKDTTYWFTAPPEGWIREKVFVEYSEEEEVEFADARHFGEGRTALEDLQEGMVLTGEVTDVWLYHGAEIDIGAQFDGLLPIDEHEWPAVRDALAPGTQVKVQVHKLRTPATLWRWPVQLTILEPAGLQEQLADPDDWQPTVDMRGWEMETILKLTGRTYETYNYFMTESPADGADNVQLAYGEDEPTFQELLDDQSEEELAYWNNWQAQEAISDVVASGW